MTRISTTRHVLSSVDHTMIASVTTRAIRMGTRCAWMAGSEKIVTLVCIDLDRPRDERGQYTSFRYTYL